MSRVKAVQQTDLSPEDQEFYNIVPTLLGRVPNFHKTLSNSPYLAMAFLPINALAQREWDGTDISGRLKELIVIKTSHTNGCKYCYAHNTALGQAAGIEEEHIQALSLNDHFLCKVFLMHLSEIKVMNSYLIHPLLKIL